MLHPIIVEKLGERRRGEEFLGERKVGRRDDTDDKGYCGATRL
jgi:hypothetical protein